MTHRSNTEWMEKAVILAKRQLTALVTQVQTFLDMHQVISAGPFLYVFVQEVSRHVLLLLLHQRSISLKCACLYVGNSVDRFILYVRMCV